MKKLCAYIIVLFLLAGFIGMRKRSKQKECASNGLPYQGDPTAQYDKWRYDSSIEADLMREPGSEDCDEILYCF